MAYRVCNGLFYKKPFLLLMCCKKGFLLFLLSASFFIFPYTIWYTETNLILNNERNRKMTTTITLIATAAMGLESIVAKGVRQIGYPDEVENGRIRFNAPMPAIP